MLVFVDESGDSGMRGKPTSSDFFVVVAVLFENTDEADRCDQRISLLREELGWHPNSEFKFSKLSATLRKKFLRAISPYDFSYFTFVMDKRKLTAEGFTYKSSFYKFPVRMLFQNAKAYLSSATVIIDRCGEREFRNQLRTYLKKHINDPTSEKSIHKVKMQESHRNNLLQLADMVCGAVSRSLKRTKSDRIVYKAIIEQKETHYQRWPR